MMNMVGEPQAVPPSPNPENGFGTYPFQRKQKRFFALALLHAKSFLFPQRLL